MLEDGVAVDGVGLAALGGGAEAHNVLAEAALDDAFEADKGAPADEQDVAGIHADVFLLGMLAPALGRDAADGAFEDFQEGLLDAFAGDVAGDGDVFGLAGDLVNFVNINDATLGAFDIIIGVLEQPQNDVLDVFADVAGLGQGGGVGDGERDIEDLGQGAGEQGFARTGGADHEDVAFLDFDLGVGVGGRGALGIRRRGAVPGGCACNGCGRRRRGSSWRAPGRRSARSSWRLISAGLGTWTRGFGFLGGGGQFLVEDLFAEDDAVVADVNARARR